MPSLRPAGLPAQQRLASSNVLVVGLGGVGVELAKNVILAGPRSVTVVDPTPTRCVARVSNGQIGEIIID